MTMLVCGSRQRYENSKKCIELFSTEAAKCNAPEIIQQNW